MSIAVMSLPCRMDYCGQCAAYDSCQCDCHNPQDDQRILMESAEGYSTDYFAGYFAE